MWTETMNGLLVELVRPTHKKYWQRVAWKELCQNPWIDWTLLHSFAGTVPLLQKYQHLHPAFPPEHILDAPRDWTYFSRTAPMSFILSTVEDPRYHWDFRYLCQNPGLTPEILAEYFWPFLSYDVRCAILRDSFLYQHPHFAPHDLTMDHRIPNVTALCHHPHFQPSWMSLFPRKRWEELDWKALSKRMDPSFIEKTWNRLPWSMEGLSFHPRLPFSLILRHRRHKKWNWEGISLHVRLSDLYAYHHCLPFRYPAVSKNLHLRPWFVREFPMKKWDRIQLAIHPAMVPRYIFEDRLLFPVWRWDHVLNNPSLDVRTFEKMHSSFLRNLGLFKNHFCRDPRFRNLQAMRIQQLWMDWKKRRRMSQKICFLVNVHHHLNADTWSTVLQFL